MRRATRGGDSCYLDNIDFYPRSPCGERRFTTLWQGRNYKISIHALLAESDCNLITVITHTKIFLSTLSLRRATRRRAENRKQKTDFYPRSPCGERQQLNGVSSFGSRDFYPRSPCGERLGGCRSTPLWKRISIHALLAESDFFRIIPSPPTEQFLSTLSLRRATCSYGSSINATRYFYPRSPCGERPNQQELTLGREQFLSTLSLRRATFILIIFFKDIRFLSTLSLRRATFGAAHERTLFSISIHALLAESDEKRTVKAIFRAEFLSTLSLRRATTYRVCADKVVCISIHALLAESDCQLFSFLLCFSNISIHALLAESDKIGIVPLPETVYFYPRSPCGERPYSLRPVHHAWYFYPRSPCGERRTCSRACGIG